jgi:hypothetical protein
MSSSETGKGARVLVPKNCTSDSFVSKNATSMRTQQILFCVCDQGIFIHLSNTWVTITFNPPNYYVQGNSMYSLLEPEKKGRSVPGNKKVRQIRPDKDKLSLASSCSPVWGHTALQFFNPERAHAVVSTRLQSRVFSVRLATAVQ